MQIAVRELEEQYLLKIVPPQNRIRMLPLGGLAFASKIEVRSDRSSKEPKSAALPTWISSRVRAILGEQGQGLHPFVRVIWREHMRLVVSYLRALDLAIDDTSSGRADVPASRSAVLRVFETRLRMAGVPADLLDTHNFDDVLRAVFEWLAGQQEPATLAQFGTSADPNEAIVLHCLALAIAQGLGAPGNGLKALVTMALPAIMLKRPILAEAERKRAVFSYLGSQATLLLSETAARLSAVDRFQPSHVVARQRPSSFGSVGLAGRDSGSLARAEMIERVYDYRIPQNKPDVSFQDLEKASKGKSSAKWLDVINEKRGNLTPRFGLAWFTIEDLLDNKRCGEFGSILNLIFFRRYSQRGEIFRTISALSLLAIIAELLLRAEWAELEGLSVDIIIPAFGSAEVAGTRSNAQTEVERSEDEEQDADDASATAETGGSQATPYFDFRESMRDWHAFASRLASDAALAPSMLGSVATRIHDDLLDLDGEVRSSWGSGDILHRQITNILNAIIAETSTVHGRKESPKSSDVPLINALRRNGRTLHPLAVMLLSCPLVWIFLRPPYKDDDGLADAARKALNEWRNTSNLEEGLDEKFDIWTKAPRIEVKIGTIVKKGEQRKVEIDGFFDLLNVVPRYADESR